MLQAPSKFEQCPAWIGFDFSNEGMYLSGTLDLPSVAGSSSDSKSEKSQRKVRKAQAQQRYRQKQKSDLDALMVEHARLLEELEQAEKQNGDLKSKHAELERHSKEIEAPLPQSDAQASPESFYRILLRLLCLHATADSFVF